jgi:restriction system protein
MSHDQLFAGLQAEWPTDADTWFNQIAVDRSEQLTKLRRIYESGKRLAFIEGESGTGKTTLVHMFVAQHSDLFPGGTAHLYGDDVPERNFDALSVLPDVADKPALLAVDELERSQGDPFRPFPTLRRPLETFPHLRILAVSRSAGRFGVPEGDVVSLTGLTDREVRELLLRRLLLFDKQNAEQLFNTLMGHRSLADAARRSPRELIVEASRLLAKGFQEPGLFGPDGRPLSVDSKEYRRVVVDISAVNDSLLRRLRHDPDLLRSLPPRKFEELVAELLARLGYEISLTAASKDGGFDMYAARREQVGQFLYLVECKRYVPPHKVGVEIVRALHGTVRTEGATAGILVTTSHFTAGAEVFQKKNKYLIQLHDYLGVQRWLATATKGSGLIRN